MIVPLASLDAAALEQLAHVTLASALTHTALWLTDLDAAREELADALAPGKTALAILDCRSSRCSSVRILIEKGSASGNHDLRSWHRCTRSPALVRSRCGELEGERSKQTPGISGVGSPSASSDSLRS